MWYNLVSLAAYRTVIRTHLEADSVGACRSNFTRQSLFTGIPPCAHTHKLKCTFFFETILANAYTNIFVYMNTHKYEHVVLTDI